MCAQIIFPAGIFKIEQLPKTIELRDILLSRFGNNNVTVYNNMETQFTKTMLITMVGCHVLCQAKSVCSSDILYIKRLISRSPEG